MGFIDTLRFRLKLLDWGYDTIRKVISFVSKFEIKEKLKIEGYVRKSMRKEIRRALEKVVVVSSLCGAMFGILTYSLLKLGAQLSFPYKLVWLIILLISFYIYLLFFLKTYPTIFALIDRLQNYFENRKH